MSVHSRFNTESEAISTTIVRELAAVEGVPPAELTPPLHDVVHVDAVNAVFASAGGRPPPDGVRLSFEYQGHLVVVEGDGRVSVDPRGERADGRVRR